MRAVLPPGPDAPDHAEQAQAAAEGLGLFALLRWLERNHPELPRIGRNKRLRDEVVSIGQDPFLGFPAGDLSAVSLDARGRWQIRNQVLGLFGPQGPLPLNTTEEALRWQNRGDDSFVAFANLVSTRFLHLFYRAWADAQPIGQAARPLEDRFQGFLAALLGHGTPAFQNRDSLPESLKVHLAGLHLGRNRAPRRLRQMLERVLGHGVQVIEHCESWIEIEPEDRNKLGLSGSTLGRDMFLGARIRTVNDRITIAVDVDALTAYRDYLPGGIAHRRLCDLVFWYLRDRFAVTLRLTLPACQIPPARLGQSAELGWMAALAPQFAANDAHAVHVAEFLLDLSSPSLVAPTHKIA